MAREDWAGLSLEEAKGLIKRRDTLLAVIADSYRRMATNTSILYRNEQLNKCQEWLTELTAINAKSPVLFNLNFEQLS